MLRSRPQPDDGWPPVGDQRRISAPDLDAAVAMARLRFGAQSRVVAARQVSRGVPGLGGKVSVEVWVQPAPTTVLIGEPERDADVTLDSLLEQADAADTVAVPGSGIVIREPHPAPDVVADPLPPGPPAAREHQRRWSKAALGRLGVPACVLSALTVPGGGTDAVWIAALAGAIASTLPAPCLPGVAVAHGTGGDGALMLLRTGLAGIALGTLTTAAGPSPATPITLAAAIGDLL